MSDKTEKPTEKKRKDSRKEGQVCKSSEVTSCIQLITIFLFFHSFAQQVVYQTINVLQLALHRVNEPFLFSLVIVMQACRDLIGWEIRGYIVIYKLNLDVDYFLFLNIKICR